MSFLNKRQVDSSGVKGSVIDLTQVDFDDTIRRNDLAIVMFCRQGCPHCFRMEPVYQELSEEMVDRVLFCRVNIMSEAALTRKYEIKGTPTFVVLKRGSVVRSIEGERSKELLMNELVKQF